MGGDPPVDACHSTAQSQDHTDHTDSNKINFTITPCQSSEATPSRLHVSRVSLGPSSHTQTGTLQSLIHWKLVVCNLAHLWTQWRFHKTGLSSFSDKYFCQSSDRSLHTWSSRSVRKSLYCHVTLLPRQMSARRHLAAPSSPHGRTIRPQGS